jgi:hypothetical protein
MYKGTVLTEDCLHFGEQHDTADAEICGITLTHET